MRHFFLVVLLNFLLFAKNILAMVTVPSLDSPVIDLAKVLSDRERQQLANTIYSFWQSTGNQLQVLTVPTLEEESIEQFAIRVFDKWQLGSARKNNGILFVMALKEKRMRIEVGIGLEGVTTDLVSGQIIDNCKTFFQNNQFFKGINFVVDSLIRQVKNEMGASDQEEHPSDSTLQKNDETSKWTTLSLVIIYFLLGGRRRRSGLFSGSGGRGSSGGSWSSGGGRSGGGGASGGW